MSLSCSPKSEDEQVLETGRWLQNYINNNKLHSTEEDLQGLASKEKLNSSLHNIIQPFWMKKIKLAIMIQLARIQFVWVSSYSSKTMHFYDNDDVLKVMLLNI